MTEAERQTVTIRMEKVQEQREKEQAYFHAQARQKAYEIWNQIIKAPLDHPYLIKKGVVPYGLKQANDGRLVVPVMDTDGTLHGLQFINGEGQKLFLTGTAKKGHFHLIGKPDQVIYLAEGYSTSASIHQATGKAAVMAFDCENLLPVAEVVKKAWPGAELIIAADDDRWTDNNPGATKAGLAAKTMRVKMAIPKFKDTESKPTDFNDLHHLEGLEAVRQQLGKAEYPNADQGWPEPEPLNPAELTTAANFPVDALPDIIGEAVREYQAFGQQPMAMVASSALAAVSLACQCHADIERAANLRGPISLNMLIEAESGERKTAADRTFSAAARDWLRDKQQEAVEIMKLGTANFKAWEATESGLLNDIKRCKDSDEKGALKEELANHYKEKPDPVYLPELFLADCNQASLMRDLSENPLHGMAVWTDEGGLVIGGDGGREDNITSFIALLNVLWDGSPVSQRRISGNRTVDCRRLTVNIMAQKQVIQKLITGQNGLARGMGLLARFLLSAPASTIGTRFFRESGPMLSVERFNKKARALLEQQPRIDENGRLDPPLLTLSEAAFDVWREFFDDIERSMASHGDLETVKDVASKTAENAARLAGCFHVFCNSSISINSESSMPLKTTLIDVKTMKSACRIAMYYLSEARRIFGCMDTPPEIIDAEKLLSWWRTRRDDKRLLPKGEIRREGPLRDTQRLNAALTVLEQSGHIEQEPIQGTKGINIKINPLVLGGGHG